jgi:hypothetical protein
MTLLTDPARLQRWARELGIQFEIKVPSKPQDVKTFIQELNKVDGKRFVLDTNNLKDSYGATDVKFIPGGLNHQINGTNLHGEEVPWGATSRKTEISAESTYLWSIPNATVLNWFGQILVFDSKNSLICDISSRWWPISALSQLIREVSLSPSETIDEAFLAMADDSPENFCHWIANIIPRTALAPPEVRILMSELQTRFQKESLELVGISDRIFSLESQKAYKVDKLIVSTTTGEYLRHPAQRGALWATQAWEDIKASVENSMNRKQKSKFLYVSRESASRRKLIPVTEVSDVVEKLGFESVCLEDLSFAEQVEHFMDAELVLGPHGAGLAGVSFMNSNSILVEIHGNDYGTPAFKLLSAFKKVRYYSITGQNVETKVGNRSDILINPKTLKKSLESMTHIQ